MGLRFCVLLAGSLALFSPAYGQTEAPAPPALTRQPTLYVVPYAHLDTQWNWDFRTTIAEYLPKTMRVNFGYFEKYPHYLFNFSGAYRYRMMKEYYPADYAKVKRYVAAGRWYPAGSSVEEGDVNAPSAEAVLRQVLYGNGWFRREFGKASAEFMLPDCFGFPASLPSILAHAGVKGFSTQKLSSMWQPSPKVGGPNSPQKTPEGIPFNVGLWEGPDGKTVIAALNPLSYSSGVDYDLSKTPPALPAPSAASAQRPPSGAPGPAGPGGITGPGGPGGPGGADPRAGRPGFPFGFGRSLEDWPKRIQTNGESSGIFADYHYIGTGDTGGAVNESSVRILEALVTRGTASLPSPSELGRRRPPMAAAQEAAPSNPPVQVGGGPVRVLAATSDQMFLDILGCCSTDRMPRYKGDLELINHSAGSLTSQIYQKQWNRRNEVLAEAAEKAAVAAAWLGGSRYPQQRLNDAWTLVMSGHFHDTMAGTSIPSAYEYAWNDAAIAMNQFAGVTASATSAVASVMDTRTKGVPLVVYNPLSIEREDVVEAAVRFPGSAPAAVRVIGPDGRETPSQFANGKVVFVAKVPSAGYAVFDVQPAGAPAASSLKVTESSLENARYRVKLDANGDVASLFDKAVGRELLSGPARLALQTENPGQWPSWNMDWEDQRKPPRAYVQAPARSRIVENGAARVALRVERKAEGSTFVQTIRLAAGDAGNRLEFANEIGWKTAATALKAAFPLAASNPEATYNWDIGTVRRGNNHERQFEVGSHQWIDLTDQSGAYGVTVLTDARNGSDKPDDGTLRLTLLYTPGVRGGRYTYQGSQDWGHHEFVYGLAGHTGDWRQAKTDWQGYRLSQPLMAFETARHAGALGKRFSLMRVSESRARVLAVKKAEESDEIVVRLVETTGQAAPGVRIGFATPVAAAREVNGQEQPAGTARVAGGELVTDLGPYQPRTFALRLSAPPVRTSAPRWQPVELAYDRAVASGDGAKPEAGFDSSHRALAAEMLPAEVRFGDIAFRLGPAGGKNSVTARGQSIALPEGAFNRVYLLAASAAGDQKATFRAGTKPVELTVQDWGGFIGQWDGHVYEVKQQAAQAGPGSFGPPGGMPGPPPGGGPGGGPGGPGMSTVYEFKSLKPGFIKRADVAWFASHRHNADGTNDPYAYSYLFAYAIDLPAGTRTLLLPDNANIRVMAVTVAGETPRTLPAHPLYDTLERAAR